MTQKQALRAVRGGVAATPQRTYEIALKGELAGHTVTMRSMTSRQVIATQRGTIDEADVLEMVAERCIAHDFEMDLLDCDYWIVGQILEQWGTAMQETAIPPVSGAS
jgi:hypothetical protein